MKMVCDRCWERCCKCSPSQQEADRQKILSEFWSSEGFTTCGHCDGQRSIYTDPYGNKMPCSQCAGRGFLEIR